MARRVAPWAVGILATTALAAAAMVAGWRVAGPTESETELGRVSFEVEAGRFGEVDAYVPIADWGIRANAFDAPFELKVEIRSLDRRGALEAAGGERSAIAATREDLESAANDAVIRGFAFALGAVLIVALVLWLLRSRWNRLGLAAAGIAVAGLVATAASLGLAKTTFDARAFSSPSFYGRGPELAQLLAFFERQEGNDRYTATFDNALTSFSAYLADAPRVGDGPDRAIHIASDLHSNIPILSTLPDFLGGEPFILAGDHGISGTEQEALTIAPRIAGLSDELIAISGNHDSRILMAALANEGVSVVGSEGILSEDGTYRDDGFLEVEGLEIAGFSDPLEWEGADPDSPERIYSFPEFEDGDERLAQAKEDVAAWFRELPGEPDIALVHQNSLAQHLAATLSADSYPRPLTIVTGHNHIQAIDRYAEGRINVVNAGSLGAGGPLRLGQEPAGLGELHFGQDAALQSVDLIQIEPLSGQAQAERIVLDIACPSAEPEEEPCHYEPD